MMPLEHFLGTRKIRQSKYENIDFCINNLINVKNREINNLFSNKFNASTETYFFNLEAQQSYI